MATKNVQLKNGGGNLLMPKTDAAIVTINSQDLTSTNAQSAFDETVSDIKKVGNELGTISGFDDLGTTFGWTQGVINSNTGAIVSNTKRCYTAIPISGNMRKIKIECRPEKYINAVVEYSTNTISTDSFVRAPLVNDGTKPTSFSLITNNYVVVVVASKTEGNISTTEASNGTLIKQATDNLNLKGLNNIQGAGLIVDADNWGFVVGDIDSSGSNTPSDYHLRTHYYLETGKIELYVGKEYYINSVLIYNSSYVFQNSLIFGEQVERFRFTNGSGYTFRVVLSRRDGAVMTTDMGAQLIVSNVQTDSRIYDVEELTESNNDRLGVVEEMLTGGTETPLTLIEGGFWNNVLLDLSEESAYSYSQPIPVTIGQRIKVSVSTGVGCYGVWGQATSTFNSNGIALVDKSTEVTDKIITIPSGVNYIFISSRNENFTTPFSPSAYTYVDGWIDDKIDNAIKIDGIPNSLKGLKLVTLGDSITQGQVMDGTAPTKPFPVLVAEAFGMNLTNYGIGGSTIGTCANYGGTFFSVADFNAATKDTSKYYVVITGNQTYSTYKYSSGSWSTTTVAMRTPLVDRCDYMANDADVIIVAGGTNDFQYNWASIGTVTDNTTGTFYGDVNLLCSRLITKYPKKCIIFMTPIKRCQTQQAAAANCDTTAHRGGSYGTIDSQNDFSKTLADYGAIIKEVCSRYSIPVIDMYSESMLNPQLVAQSSLFDSYKTHPYQDGHNLMARLIVGKLRSIFGTLIE